MSLNIDNTIINGVPQATTTEELREWLLSRNLPNVITAEGFQQNIEMYQESSALFEEDNDNILQQLITGNEYFNPGLLYDSGLLNNGQQQFNIYGLTNKGTLNLDNVTSDTGSLMPHIQCQFPEFIIPTQSSVLCELNLYTYEAVYTADEGQGANLFDSTTDNGQTVGDIVQPERFGTLPPFMMGTFDNRYGTTGEYPNDTASLVAKTQSQNPSNNPYSWFMSNPLMYDLFISPNFDGNFMRFDATTVELSPLDNRFYGLKISERGFQFNNASAPDGSGVKTLYTPLQPYNDGITDSAPPVLLQNTRILEQWILGSFGTRTTRDQLLNRNLFSSGEMYIGGTPNVPAIDFIEGTIDLNNSYYSLAWVLSGPRKPKTNTNFFVQQLRLSDHGGITNDFEFGVNRSLIEEIRQGRNVTHESQARWSPEGGPDDFIVNSLVSPVGDKGLLNFTQKLVNTSTDNGDELSIGSNIRQDTRYLRTKNGTVSRGSGIWNYDNDGQKPYSRSWVRPSNIYSPESGNETPESYSRYDALLRHRPLVTSTTGDTFGMRGGWSNGSSVISDVGGAHIAQSSKDDIRNFMFSLENLAWKDNVDGVLAKHEIGPNKGRLMWFPPYIESWTENSNANYNQTDIIGRIEPIWTYKNSVRQANLNFMMVTDYPEAIDTMNFTENSDMEAAQFFGGQDFEKHISNIAAGKTPTFSNPEEYADLLAAVVAPEPVNTNQIPEGFQVPTETGPADSIPLKVFYFSGCSEINSVVFDTTNPNPEEVYSATQPIDTKAGSLCEQQFLHLPEATPDTSVMPPFINTFGEEQPGAELSFESLARFLASEDGKQFKVVITTYSAPVFNLQADDQLIEDIADSMDPSQGSQVVQFAEDQSSQAQEFFGRDKSICAPLRAENLKTKLTDKIIYYETGDPSATPEVKPYSEDYIDEWYSDLEPPEGRWEIRDGGRVPGFGQLLRDAGSFVQHATVQDPGIYEIGGVLGVLPVTISIEPNPELLSNTAFIEAEEEYTKRLTETHTNYVQNNLRIPDGDYFEKLQENDLFAYQNYKDKVKNFHPAFHSVHPCGFNSRMTFLNQCLRPGPSINSTVGPNNMAFGRPPICVLRLGDFYHCKVVINNIDFSYEQPFWDLNPEGIGAQPWIVRVSMQFFIVGGMSLSGPLSQLQNAVSFNYFANTEICEPDRANPTKYSPQYNSSIKEETPEEITITNTNIVNTGSTTYDYSGDSGGGYDYSGDSGDGGGNNYDYSGDSGGTDDNENTDTSVKEYIFQDWNLVHALFENIWDNTDWAGGTRYFQTGAEVSLGRVSEVGITPAVYKVSYTIKQDSLMVDNVGRQLSDLQTHHMPLITDTEGCVGTMGCAAMMSTIKSMNEQVTNHYIEVFDKYKNATPVGYWNNPTAYDTPPSEFARVLIEFCSSSDGDIYANQNLQTCLTTAEAIYNNSDAVEHSNF
tara:strand:- start:10052 stop:14380 length:4329 start_codon:yes stop_codon:yes gene_type:complete